MRFPVQPEIVVNNNIIVTEPQIMVAIHFKFSKIDQINIEITVTVVVVVPEIVQPPPAPRLRRLLTVNIEEIIGPPLLIITKKDNNMANIGIMITTMVEVVDIKIITIEIFMVDEDRVSMAMKTNLLIITKFSIGALVIAAVAITASTIIGIRLNSTTTDGDTDNDHLISDE